ncbi:MAG: 4-hydroxybenzoate octaprenyltransferase [Gammaproteobacteria bacterium]|nr:4-hydroxybenzoate octaprenyltransferase [Gammaproteobacteria bacterium]NNF62240.1 4-hydroxybenzoate octaprenyltransferase [Gammaproteobacteria bacterium]NNM21037.1 4-hydroxybenzoate octaprenyltransferase [Gammaproteobacteria bacterium]
MPERLRQYALLIRLDRPIGTYLVMWPMLWALWIAAAGKPDPYLLVVFVAGSFLMRSAGCAINDFADRNFDPHVQRTRERPLAAGRLAPAEALAVFAILALIAFGLVLTTNALTIRLAIAGVLLAATYPFLKRWTNLPQYYLGIAFAWGTPMAFAAQTGEVPPIAWLLFGCVVLWTAAFDTIYAMVDRADDIRIGVKSTAVLFGSADRVIIAIMQLLMLVGLWLVGRWAGLDGWYFAGLVAATLSLLYQQFLIAGRDGGRCFRAFLNNNMTGALVFAGIALDYLYQT